MNDQPIPASPGDHPVAVSETRRRPRSRLRRWFARLGWLIVIALVLGGIAWIVLHPRAAPPHAGRFAMTGAMPVVAATTTKGDIDIELKALGTVTALATVTVKTQIGGQLTQIAFTEGQTVHAGDFLAQIDQRPYQLTLAQNEGQLARDQALLAAARVDLARYQKLVAEDSIAHQQLDTQASLVHQYEGTVATDEAQVNTAKLNIAYCHIVSPVTGRVGLRQVDQGNYVQTSDPNGIIVITQMQPITVIASIPEDNLPAIQKRLHAGATLPVTAYDRSDSIKLATGKLVTLDNQIDTTTGTIKLRAQFDNQDESLFPNQFVNIRVLVDVLHDATVIPTVAVQRGAPGTYVYLVQPDSTVAVRPIKLGPTTADQVAILSGLEPGDRVVIDGADKLRDGAHITLPTADAQAGAGAGAGSGSWPGAGHHPGGPKTGDDPAGEEHHHHHRTDQ
jgi:multidrug efflux system membrane fusion protein